MLRIAMLVVSLFLVSCATSGHRFDSSALAGFESGVTTIAAASKSLGAKPVQTIMLGTGEQAVYWRFITVNSFSSETKIQEIALIFNAAGTLDRAFSFVNVPVAPDVLARLNPASITNN